jgi:hypothetical protein
MLRHSAPCDSYDSAVPCAVTAPMFLPCCSSHQIQASHLDHVGVQVVKKTGTGPPWQPYERARSENSILLPWLPCRFYRARWRVMACSPLCWRMPGVRYTVGEALAVTLLLMQLVWTSTAWLLDLSDYRHDLRATGACSIGICKLCLRISLQLRVHCA